MTARAVIVPEEHWHRLRGWTAHAGLFLSAAEVGPGQLPRFTLTTSDTGDRLSVPELSHRECHTLALMSEGLTNAEVGHKLGLTEGGVKTHLRAVFRKIGARNRAHAVSVAYQRGLLTAWPAPTGSARPRLRSGQ